MRNHIVVRLLITLVILGGCSTGHEKKLYMIFENVEGLSTESIVQSRGVQIGRVTNMKLSGTDKVIVETAIEKQYNIPDKSVFWLVSASTMGTKEIKVDFIESETFYHSNDTVLGTKEADLKDFVTQLKNDSAFKSVFSKVIRTLIFGDTTQTKQK